MNMPIDETTLQELEKAFSPSAPISARDFFLGRTAQIEAVVNAINERGQNVIVYGERGVGKTSFANIVGSEVRNIFPVKVTCNRNDSFKGLWEKAFAKVHFQRKVSGIGFMPIQKEAPFQLDLFLPEKEDITSLDVQMVLERVSANLLFIFDEYDAVSGIDVQTRMADTIKALSDNAPRVTIILVGVANNLTTLIGEHRSIERCLRQVLLPRMSDSELVLIVDRGLTMLKLEMPEVLQNKIVELSLGFPHFTHLLAKQSCRAALEDCTSKITEIHYFRALGSAVERADESIRSQYQRATFSTKDKSNFETVLWACALAEQDEHKTFRAKSVVEAFEGITKRSTSQEALAYNLGCLCSENRGSPLERIRNSSYIRYRFRNPMFMTYVRLKLETLTKMNQISAAINKNATLS